MASNAVTTLPVASWGINPEHRVGMNGFQGVTGVVVEWDETAENVSADEMNEVGSRIGMTIYDRRYSVNCVVQCSSGSTAPAAGARVYINSNGDSRNYFVRNARISESNSNYRRISLSLEGSYYSDNTNFLNVADGISGTTTSSSKR